MTTILIVDNEPEEISLLQEMLDEEDYRFVTAATAGEAWRSCAPRNFDFCESTVSVDEVEDRAVLST